ncbi:MAG: hypothetical protein ACQESK_07200 [Bacteroidota bacterium]
MKKIKILSLFMLCFLLQACPNLLDDSPDFYVTIINNSDEKIFYHTRSYQSNEDIQENHLYQFDPRGRDDAVIPNGSVQIGFDNSNRVLGTTFMIYKESTFEENDWETIRDEGLFDARYDLTDDELAEMDYTIEFTGE